MPSHPRRRSTLLSLGAAILGLVLAILFLGGPASAQPADAGATTRTVPAANAVLPAAPGTLSITTGGARSGRVSVFSSDHKVLASGPLTPVAGRSGVVALALPATARLDKGVYSVVWTAGTQTGSFAFDIEPGAAAKTVTNPKPQTPLGPVEDSAIAWGTWITLMGLLGTVVFALLVAGPVTRRIGRGALTAATARLARVAVVAGVLFVPAFLIDTAHDAAGDAGGFAYRAAWNELFDGTNAGRLLGLEFVLMLVAVALVAPLTVRSFAGSRSRTGLLSGSGLAAAVALCTTKFPTAVPDDWGREFFDTGIWFGHLLGGAVWIGGLLGLLTLALPGGITVADRAAFWSPAIRRFSVVAMVCVGAIVLSGLWLYWVHVDGLSQLFTTMYGRVLGVKILVFGTMLALGAVNQFWLHPKVDALRAAGDDRPLRTVLAREFRATVALEAALGMSVLMIAPFLHGSARNQAFQADAADLTRTAGVGSHAVRLTPSGSQPGLTDYTVRLPDDTARLVTVTFASTELGVPAQEASATRIGAGSYRVSGYYTPQVGTWQVAVTVDHGPPAEFTLPIKADPAPDKIAPKLVRGSTWLWGSLETIAVIAAMLGGFAVSGRLARRRLRTVQPTALGDEDVLVPA